MHGALVKNLIAILALMLLVLPMVAGIRRLRRLPPKDKRADD